MIAEQGPKTTLANTHTDRLVSELKLPLNMSEQIEIDVSRLQLIMQLFGIKTLKISGETGQIKRISAQTIGLSQDGTTMMGATGATEVDEYQTKSSFNFPEGRTEIGREEVWLDVLVTVNTSDLKEAILESGQDIRQVEVWAAEVNQRLTNALVRVGFENLVADFSKFKDTILLFFTVVAYALLMGNFPAGFQQMVETGESPYQLETLPYIFLPGLMVSLIATLTNREKWGAGRRISAFLAIHLDRFIVGWIAAQSKDLLETEKKRRNS